MQRDHNAPGPEVARGPDVSERRASPRTKLVTGVGFASDSNFYTGFTEDISEGGLFVATVMLQPLGSQVELTFTLPNDEEITAFGVVRWLRNPRDEHPDCVPGMGIQFEALPSTALESIREYVALREPIFYES